MTTTGASAVETAVLAALAAVTDPELDESIVELEFVTATIAPDGHVCVELRLPTFWCAPNFAYMMAEDARAAVLEVPGVTSVEVRLLDHFAEEEVNAGVGNGKPFKQAFPGVSNGNLEPLRRLFWVKAFTVRQEQLLRTLLTQGRSAGEVVALSLGDLNPAMPEVAPYIAKRARLGLPMGPEAPLAITPNGHPLTVNQLADYLRRARMVRISVETNTILCRGLHATRYGRAERSYGSPDKR